MNLWGAIFWCKDWHGIAFGVPLNIFLLLSDSLMKHVRRVQQTAAIMKPDFTRFWNSKCGRKECKCFNILLGTVRNFLPSICGWKRYILTQTLNVYSPVEQCCGCKHNSPDERLPWCTWNFHSLWWFEAVLLHSVDLWDLKKSFLKLFSFLVDTLAQWAVY